MQRRIVVTILLNVLVVLIGLGVVSELSAEDAADQAVESQRRLAAILAGRADDVLRQSFARLYEVALAGVLEDRPGSASLERSALRSAYEHSLFNRGIFLVSRDRVVRAHGSVEKLVGTAAWPREARPIALDRPTVAILESGADRGLRVVVPVDDGRGELRGWVVGEASLLGSELHDLLETVRAVPGAVASLDDSGGKVLLSSSGGSFRGGTGRSDDEEAVVSAALKEAPWALSIREPRSRIFAPVTALRIRILALGVLALVSSLVLAAGMSWSIVTPVRELTRATERIANGDLGSEVRGGGVEELGTLSRSFETMRARLLASADEVRRAQESLELRVEERTREVRTNRARLARLLREILRAQESERARIARELHDETSQALSALGMSLEVATLDRDLPSTTRGRLVAARQHVHETLDGINRIIRDLRPPVLEDLGLDSAIHSLLQNQLGGRGIRFSLKTDPDLADARLDRQVELTLFRIVQEAVNNAAKHARPRTIDVTLHREDGALRMDVEDDGIGFDVEQEMARADAAPEAGFGLLGIAERVKLLGGDLVVESQPGRGTRVRVIVPFSHLVETTTEPSDGVEISAPAEPNTVGGNRDG